MTWIVVLLWSNWIGSAPYFRLVARLLAALGEVAGDLRAAVGDHALEDRRGDHLAVEHDRELVLGAGHRLRELQLLRGAPLSSCRLTTHCTCCCGIPADAEVIWVPRISAGDRRYFTYCPV